MRPPTSKAGFSASLFLCVVASASIAHGQQPAAAEAPARGGPSVSGFDSKNYLPLCSTEKVNGNCFVNIDRRYPLTMPTFQMRPGSHITVYVFHPFAFETLTLDAGAAQAFEGSDQASAFVAAAGPLGKGAIFGLAQSFTTASNEIGKGSLNSIVALDQEPSIKAGKSPDERLAEEILADLKTLDGLLADALAPASQYFEETTNIYIQVREVESAAPRAVADVNNTLLRTPGVPPGTPSPWDKYPDWRKYMIDEISQQGNDTSQLLRKLPVPCQKSSDPLPPVGPWLPPARICKSSTATTQASETPLAISDNYESVYKDLQGKLMRLGSNKPDLDTYQKIQTLKVQVDQRKEQVSQAITNALVLLPAIITKVTTDMQGVLANISMASDVPESPIRLGVIPPPNSASTPDSGEKRVLTPYKALGPQIIFTVNAQNEIANPLLGLPTATQKQAVVTITALYAAPRFEVSAGTFLSWLPNRTFANYTDVTMNGGTPAPLNVKISMTKTSPPLVVPFAAANYRVSPEFTWLGKRRGAVYATVGIGLNPYDTQVEYVGGLSFSWRFLMFSPVYHLGHNTHLTQDEQVGQIWCQYDNGATATTTPPLCAGTPPTPSTKSFWTGAFAFGISVRIPTTFSSTNH